MRYGIMFPISFSFIIAALVFATPFALVLILALLIKTLSSKEVMQDWINF